MTRPTLISIFALCVLALALVGLIQKAIALAVQYPHTAAFGLALVVGPVTVVGCLLFGLAMVRRSL